MAIYKRNHLLQTIILDIHVSFRGVEAPDQELNPYPGAVSRLMKKFQCLTPSLKYRLFTRDLRNSMEGSFKNHQKSNLSLYNCNHVCMPRQLHKTLHCTRMRHIVDPGIAGQFKEGFPFGCIRQVFAHRLQESPT